MLICRMILFAVAASARVLMLARKGAAIRTDITAFMQTNALLAIRGDFETGAPMLAGRGWSVDC
ncbi:hypothetical protein COCSUDRAFT_32717 [Coccomyxa subellipsoidea C-169]|uniref:Uncharacterized protein n=1 Tax=Coccomyxa subellipsoidea (strain C-169) TaxID=574566 RepID=I0Z1A6_COCSC|nr:hypothetical protein COCSUDRAFT_32717 [Coccomyxa subellipsoidea C-169]EIE24425.1 hypothetical protein COCSUDRAFT_32717 [Coccomyxa subellipsoidea C-169]|eukprot:XP_005648969.1 hypothetical protein COCSUDRAFT_32717 [Coccomyxa subellipsoidea C-169]